MSCVKSGRILEKLVLGNGIAARWVACRLGYEHDFVFILDDIGQMLEVKTFVIDSFAALDFDSVVVQTPFAVRLDWYSFVYLLKQVEDCWIRAGVNCPDYMRVRQAMTPNRQP
jgi:hypothetical protein